MRGGKAHSVKVLTICDEFHPTLNSQTKHKNKMVRIGVGFIQQVNYSTFRCYEVQLKLEYLIAKANEILLPRPALKNSDSALDRKNVKREK